MTRTWQREQDTHFNFPFDALYTVPKYTKSTDPAKPMK